MELIGKKWNTRESVFKRNKINKERGKSHGDRNKSL